VTSDAVPVFSVQADPAEVGSWQGLARDCERDGFDALLVANHPGTCSSPFVALAAAAAVTERIRLGSYVVNAGVWEPLTIAGDVATLDRVSGGRALLGIGAGHTPAEWTMRGRAYPHARDRIARMMEVTHVTRQLLAGERVTFHGEHVDADEAQLQRPRPVQDPVPLLVGGNGSTVLRFAAEHADIVGMAGLGRTLEDGHRHEVRWRPVEIDERVDLVHATAAAAGRTPVLEALVQHLEITEDAEQAASRLAERVDGLDPGDVLAAPYALVGTVDELVAELRRHRERWGFERFVVRAPSCQDAAAVLSACSAITVRS
jgi:probable F420-dependent oxidoreductase